MFRCLRFVLVASPFLPGPQVPVQASPPKMTAVVRNFAGIADAVWTDARNIATDIYRKAGIEISWQTQDELRHVTPANPRSACVFSSTIFINLLTAPMEDELSDDVFGQMVAGVGAGLVRICPRRIESVATLTGVSAAVLMGDVVAHEIGHLLLPDRRHAISGLMRETIDLRLAAESRFVILSDQAAEMRNTIVAKSTQCAR